MIHRIRIRNFKSFGEVTVNLDPLTVLIGRSGTGKSNFVEAIRFLRDALRPANWNLQLAHGQEWSQLVCASSQENELLFEIDFVVPNQGAFRYLLHFSNPDTVCEEKLDLDGRLIVHHRDGKWIRSPKNNQEEQSPRSVVLGTISGIRECTIAHLALTTGIGCYQFGETSLRKPPTQEVPSPASKGFADFGQNYLEVFDTILNDLSTLGHWETIKQALQAINPSVNEIDLSRPANDSIVVSHRVFPAEERSMLLDVSQESEGFRRFFAHLLALYQTPPKQTLVFEEPEKGIHPGGLATLAEQFKLCPTKGRGQVILTSHSPELLNYFDAEQLRVVEIENHLTKISTVADDQMESLREGLLTPGELLTVDLARSTEATTVSSP